MNDQTAKHGFVDKAPVSQNETNTARQSLYGLFRHRSGLQTLSALFATVVEKRQAHSKISSGSAFRPPPRVTLTEPKRKTWLSDLASSVVPLRKLSRTIPQGIRGQILLDQCFANSIPIGRALWFAKCVGANEIRTLKRKGTSATFTAGAEIKWLRDWTTNIEQFLESSIEQCGQAGWRPRMNYALSLAIRLYAESLLDRDHYLDWIVKSTSSASLSCLPVWLLMVNLHKADLLKHRRRGKLLAEGLLEKLRTLTGLAQSLLAPLVRRLKQMLRSIMQTSIACFVMPQSWRKYKGTLESCLDLNSAGDSFVLEQFVSRNARLSVTSGLDSSQSSTPRQAVLCVLDCASSPFNIRQIEQDCQAACDDMDVLVEVILEWSTTRFRAGGHRAYLGVELLKLCQNEVDIDSAVIRFLASQESWTSCHTLSLRLFISELVRSQVFSLGRYLQWVTARGGLRQISSGQGTSAVSSSTSGDAGKSEDPTGFGPAQVLTAVPLSSLKPVVKNLRNILLARAGFSVGHEASLIKLCKDYLSRGLPGVIDYELDQQVDHFTPDFSGLSWSARFEIGDFLRRHLFTLGTRKGPITKQSRPASPVIAITDAEFRFARSICEEIGDLSVLADIVKFCTISEDEKLLASIADTVHFHLDAFSALGVFEDLHSRLFQAYSPIRATSGLPREFIVSLISLGSVVSSHLISVLSLQQALARGDRSLAVAACSPVSDGMAESLQQAGPTFMEEFEAVLSTGNRMEEQTMTQLFNVLAGRLEKGHYQIEAENDEVLCALYARLRIYRIAQFDTLIAAWVRKLLTTDESRVQQLLPILISTSCVSFEECVNILTKVEGTKQTRTDEASSVHPHLANFLANINAAEKRIDSVSYKLKLENARHIKESPYCALQLRIRAGVSDDVNSTQPWSDLLIRLVLQGKQPDTLRTPCSNDTITSVLDDLLQLPGDGPTLDFLELVKRTNDLSMPFCRFRLQKWAIVATSLSLNGRQDSLVETLFELARSGRDKAFMEYTTAIGLDVASEVRQKAEEAFFGLPLFPVPGRNAPIAFPVASSIEQASVYLRIVCLTAHSIPSAGVQSIVSTLVEKFVVLLRGLIAGRIPANNDNTNHETNQPASGSEEPTAVSLTHLTSILTLLLRMTSIHRTAFVSSRPEPLSSPLASQKQAQQDTVKILALLTNIALHPSLGDHSNIVEHIFDVTATIVDDASEEVRTLCARILKDKMHDQRVEYLLGSSASNNSRAVVSVHATSETGWSTDGLQIVKDGKMMGPYKARTWEMLEGGAEASISLALFDTRREV
jgi:mediator of RNA polymerase II transcription subunit 12, fungi type